MADKQVRIVISAQDSFSSVLSKYSSAMSKATADTKQLDDASKKTADGGLTGLNNTLNNLMGVFAGIQILGVVTDMVALGNAANATHATFTALSGGATQATNTLNALRAATGGVVADTELMAGANRLLAMNIATSGQQAADLAGVAVNLGKAFGQDAASAIENFSLMIANQSLLRLDSLGISAAAVRERMKELAAEFPEMDKQARFTQATLEQATVTVDRLGSSITAAQTPVAQLQTTFENLKTSVGQSMASIVNDAITAADQLNHIIYLVQQNGLQAVANAALNPENSLAQQRALPLADAGVEMFSEYLDMGGMDTTMTGLQMQEMLERAFTMVEENPALKSDWGKVVEEIIGSPFDPNSTAMVALRDSLSATYSLVTKEAATNAENQSRELSRFQAIMASQANPGMTFDQMQQQNYEAAKYGALTDQFGGTTGKGTSWFESTFGGGGDVAAASELFAQLESAQASLTAFQSSAGGIGKFIDAGTMDGITDQFEKLQELNEQGLITDDSLAKAEEFKNKAQEAADAFAQMSLTDIFGQTNGGMQGEIGDLVIDKMKANGATDEQIAAAQSQFNLGSGRETSASQAMDTTLAPMIADLAQTDPALAQKAVENVNAFLESAALMGLTPDQIAAGLPGAAGFMPTAGGGGMGGGSFSIKPGQTLSEISAQTGIPVDQLLAATGASSANVVQPGTYGMGGGSYMPTPGFNPQMYAQGWQNPYSATPGTGGAAPSPFMTNPILGMGGEAWGAAEGAAGSAEGAQSPFDMAAIATDKIKDNTADIAEQVDSIALATDGVSKAFDDVAAPRTIQITVETIDKTGGLLKAILGGLTPGNITLGTGTSVRDNGGRVAGQDGRVGQKPGLTK
jgi:hypothetical protein